MQTIPELLDQWRRALEALNTCLEAENDRCSAGLRELEDAIAEIPAVTADDWRMKVAVATYCDPAGDGPIHAAVAAGALNALGLDRFVALS